MFKKENYYYSYVGEYHFNQGKHFVSLLQKKEFFCIDSGNEGYNLKHFTKMRLRAGKHFHMNGGYFFYVWRKDK